MHTSNFSWNDTKLSVCLDECSNFPQSRALFDRVKEHLIHRQFRLRTDPSVRHLKSLHSTHLVGRRRDLRFKLECSGRVVSVEFWQDKVRPALHPNPNGGRYDFNKFELMPPLLRRFFQVEQHHLTRLMQGFGYTETTRPTLRTHSALEVVVDRIRTCGHWRNGVNPLGTWQPRDPRVAYSRNTDRDGRELAPGQVKYFYNHHGHLQRGTIYQCLNSQWFIATGDREFNCILDPASLFDFAAAPRSAEGPPAKPGTHAGRAGAVPPETTNPPSHRLAGGLCARQQTPSRDDAMPVKPLGFWNLSTRSLDSGPTQR